MPTQANKTILLATDQQRSVLIALGADLRQSTAYSPYGHQSQQSGLQSLLAFNGELPDALTEHYHLGNGYRQFNPKLMRFNKPDSWSPFGKGGLNAYAYCAGDPVNRVDPNGHMFKWPFKKSPTPSSPLSKPHSRDPSASHNSPEPATPSTAGTSVAPTVKREQLTAIYKTGKDRYSLVYEMPDGTHRVSLNQDGTPAIKTLYKVLKKDPSRNSPNKQSPIPPHPHSSASGKLDINLTKTVPPGSPTDLANKIALERLVEDVRQITSEKPE